MLPKKNRLKKKKDFDKVLKEGKSFKEKALVLKVRKNNIKINRFGFVVSKKVSKKAVKRNQIKRRLREIVRKKTKDYKKSFDLVFIALPGLELMKFPEIKEVTQNLLKKSKILNYDK